MKPKTVTAKIVVPESRPTDQRLRESDRLMCKWCLRRKANSEWEQMSLTRGWMRMCRRCANRRLRNPNNALLSIRKIQSPNGRPSGQ